MSLRVASFAAAFALAGAVKLIDLEEGSLFTKCIKISDLETKTMEDDIELVDRDAVSGCCPGDTEPGIKFELKSTSYVGPQIVCGFTKDMSSSSNSLDKRKSNGVEYDIVRDQTNALESCNFNYCFVMKQNLDCANGAKQMINGCCAPKAVCEQNSCGFNEDCKNYVESITALNYTNGRVNHCTVYHKDYKARGNEGTREEEDDIDTSGDAPKLLTENPRVYARCEGGFVDRTSASEGDSASTVVTVACDTAGITKCVSDFSAGTAGETSTVANCRFLTDYEACLAATSEGCSDSQKAALTGPIEQAVSKMSCSEELASSASLLGLGSCPFLVIFLMFLVYVNNEQY